MTKPQVATILDDGTYGQRDMTTEEIAELPAPTETNRIEGTDETLSAD
jgi:hypothetical protein